MAEIDWREVNRRWAVFCANKGILRETIDHKLRNRIIYFGHRSGIKRADLAGGWGICESRVWQIVVAQEKREERRRAVWIFRAAHEARPAEFASDPRDQWIERDVWTVDESRGFEKNHA